MTSAECALEIVFNHLRSPHWHCVLCDPYAADVGYRHRFIACCSCGWSGQPWAYEPRAALEWAEDHRWPNEDET